MRHRVEAALKAHDSRVGGNSCGMPIGVPIDKDEDMRSRSLQIAR